MERYVIAIDQSTSASKVFLMDARGRIVKRFSKPHQQYYPKPAFVEHDAEEIWQNVREGVAAMAEGATGGWLSGCRLLWDTRPTCQSWQKITPPSS